MKRLLVLALFGLILSGCAGQNTSEMEHFVGWIDIFDDTLYIDRVELIVFDDMAQGLYPGILYTLYKDIALVGRNDEPPDGLDMPSGYHIRHLEEETLSFVIINETTFNFIDTQLLFVKDPDGSRLYSTNDADEFLQYHYPSVPYFISVREGKVIGVTESFWLTQ